MLLVLALLATWCEAFTLLSPAMDGQFTHKGMCGVWGSGMVLVIIELNE